MKLLNLLILIFVSHLILAQDKIYTHHNGIIKNVTLVSDDGDTLEYYNNATNKKDYILKVHVKDYDLKNNNDILTPEYRAKRYAYQDSISKNKPKYDETILFNNENRKYQSTVILKFDSLSSEKLFILVKEWIALSYKSSNDVVQFADKEAGKIIVKGNFSTSIFLKQGWIRHTFIVDIKNGKIKCTYTDFSYYSISSGEIYFEDKYMLRDKLISTAQENVYSSNNSLKTFLEKNHFKNDDW